MTPDQELAKQLREDFSAELCINALFVAASDMASAIGVDVSWSIDDAKDIDVDTARLLDALSRLSAAGGAILVGGKIDAIKQLSQMGTKDD